MDSSASAEEAGPPPPRKRPLYVVLAVAAAANLFAPTLFSIHEGYEGESLFLRLYFPGCVFLEYAACYGAVAWDSLITFRSGFLITTGIILTFGLATLTSLVGFVWIFIDRKYPTPFVALLLFSVLANVVFLGHTFTHAQRIRYRTTLFGAAIGVVAAIALPCMLFALWKQLA